MSLPLIDQVALEIIKQQCRYLRSEGRDVTLEAIVSEYRPYGLSRTQAWRRLNGKSRGRHDLLDFIASHVGFTAGQLEWIEPLLAQVGDDRVPEFMTPGNGQGLLREARRLANHLKTSIIMGVLVSGSLSAADTYFEFYLPDHSLHGALSDAFRRMDPELWLQACETLVNLYKMNARRFSPGAVQKRRLAGFYLGRFGESGWQGNVFRWGQKEPELLVRFSCLLGQIQGSDEGIAVDAMRQWFRWWHSDEEARKVDVFHTIQYYGGLRMALGHIFDDLGASRCTALLPSCLNTAIAHFQNTPEESIASLREMVELDESWVARIQTNVNSANYYRYDRLLLRSRWDAFLNQVRSQDYALSARLAG